MTLHTIRWEWLVSMIGHHQVTCGSWTHSLQDEKKKRMVENRSSIDDNDTSNNNSNLNNNSDIGDSTASKGTLDTALVHSDIEEEASSSSFIRTCVRYKQMICVNSVLLTLTLLTQTNYISTSKPYLDMHRLLFILAVHTSGGPFGHRSGSLCAS